MSSSSSIRVALVSTAPEGQPGSMRRYADIAAHALSATDLPVRVSRPELAAPLPGLSRFSRKGISKLHHLTVAANALIRGCGGADILHLVDASHAYVALLLPRMPTVATSHDVIPFLQSCGRFPQARPGHFATWLIRRSIDGLRRVDRIISVSHHTKADLVASAGIDPQRIRVVHSAIFPAMVEAARREPAVPWPERRGSPHAYILSVGNNAFYKNRAGVLRIFARVRAQADVRLKMVGPRPTPEIDAVVRDLALDSHVDLVVDPDDGLMIRLYRGACLFLFPSLYEGFGWPPLEAMALGCPVVCSSAASLPEVADHAALMGPAEDEDQLARHCATVLQSPELAAELARKGQTRAARFSAEAMAQGLVSTYREVLARA